MTMFYFFVQFPDDTGKLLFQRDGGFRWDTRGCCREPTGAPRLKACWGWELRGRSAVVVRRACEINEERSEGSEGERRREEEGERVEKMRSGGGREEKRKWF